jgi:hypothetical protein
MTHGRPLPRRLTAAFQNVTDVVGSFIPLIDNSIVRSEVLWGTTRVVIYSYQHFVARKWGQQIPRQQ